MLAGYIAAENNCEAPEVSMDVGNCPASACTDANAPGAAATTACACVANAEPAADAAAVTCEPTCEAYVPTWLTTADNPAKLIGGTLKGANVEATAVAPA